MPEELLTVEDLAKLLHCSCKHAYVVVKQADFPKIKMGKRYLIPINEFNKWVHNYTRKEYVLNKPGVKR